MNQHLQNNARTYLKENLAKLTEANQLVFKRMYAGGNLKLDINTVIDNMPEDKLDWAMQQVERTLNKK